MKSIDLLNKQIGANNPVLIIAEAGVNHNGRIDLAKKLILKAKEAGADVVKFQTFNAEDVVIPGAEMAEYQKNNLKVNKSQREMLQDLSLNEYYYEELFQLADKEKIILLSTPHGGFRSVDLLEKYNICAYKIGSGDLTNFPLISYIAKTGKPIILSTGMATFSEIDKAVSIIKKHQNTKIAILHCTTSYPCPFDMVNLNAMKTMIKKYIYPIGYSDHTKGIEISLYAVLMGATIIEKHFTLDKKLPGPDQKNSIEPEELKQMIMKIRKIGKLNDIDKKNKIDKIPKYILGKINKEPSNLEIKIAKNVRKSLVWSRNLPKSHIIKEKDINIKRPGTGLLPEKYWDLIGKKTKKFVFKDKLIEMAEIL